MFRRKNTKLIVENWRKFLNEENEPTAIAVLGAPASGKSYNMGQLRDTIKDIESFSATLSSGVEVTVDKIRKQVQAMD